MFWQFIVKISREVEDAMKWVVASFPINYACINLFELFLYFTQVFWQFIVKILLEVEDLMKWVIV